MGSNYSWTIKRTFPNINFKQFVEYFDLLLNNYICYDYHVYPESLAYNYTRNQIDRQETKNPINRDSI